MDHSCFNFYFCVENDGRLKKNLPSGLVCNPSGFSYIQNTNKNVYSLRATAPDCYVDIRTGKHLDLCECCQNSGSQIPTDDQNDVENPFLTTNPLVNKNYILPLNHYDLQDLKSSKTILSFHGIKINYKKLNDLTIQISSTTGSFIFNMSTSSSNVTISGDNSVITLIGPVNTINSYLSQIYFISTDIGISSAQSIENNEDIGTLDIIKFIISTTINNKTFSVTRNVILILDPYRYSRFQISGNLEGHLNSVVNVIYSNFKVRTNSNEYSNSVVFTDSTKFLIDAEKHINISNDDNLCWAASSSNMLEFTRWGRTELGMAKNVTDREDLFFKYYRDHSANDEGYWIDAGLEWFFNGSFVNVNGAWKNNGGGNVLQLNPSNYVATYNFVQNYTMTVSLMAHLKKVLLNGWAVGLHIRKSDGSGGHAITCLGIAYNNAYPETDKRHYNGLFIADSDNHGFSTLYDSNKVYPDTATYGHIEFAGGSSYNNNIPIFTDLYKFGYRFIEEFITLYRRNGTTQHFFTNYGSLIESSTGRSLR